MTEKKKSNIILFADATRFDILLSHGNKPIHFKCGLSVQILNGITVCL